jgi:hypothetical protein
MTKQPEKYSPPKLLVIGSLAALTQTQYKQFNSSDGFTFMGSPIGNASV